MRAMTEGAIHFALSAVLKTRIPIPGGSVQESNFHDFPVLRIGEAPDIDAHVVPSEREPSGAGELGAVLIPAAVGVRVRHLPVDARPLKRAGGIELWRIRAGEISSRWAVRW